MNQSEGQVVDKQQNKGSGEKQKLQQPNWLRRQYVYARQCVLLRTSGKVHRLLEQEFNPIFTWSLVAVLQVAYLGWLFSRGSLNQANVLVRFGAQIHIGVLLVGGAALRCVLAWLVYAADDGSVSEKVPAGTLFDYPRYSKTSLMTQKKAQLDGPDNPDVALTEQKILQQQPSEKAKKVQ